MGAWLTICIPTYNRAGFLSDLLTEIGRQLRAGGWAPEDIAIAVSDNGSPDATPDVLQRARDSGLPISWQRQSRNLGINPNLCAACEMAKGRYGWLLGDDELLDPHALQRVWNATREGEPGMVILYDTRFPSRPPQSMDFPTYRDFAAECARTAPERLTEQTLLSSNVFRTDCYDAGFARASLDTDFPHMFGLVRGVHRCGAPVRVLAEPVITTRGEDRPPPPDGQWVPIDRKWIAYMAWLREELGLPELDPYAPTRAARRALVTHMLTHPIAFARRYGRSALNPSAWRFLFDRLFLRPH